MATLPNVCGWCCRECKSLKCGRCMVVRYCNQNCQRNDWQNHRKVCRVLSEPAGLLPNTSENAESNRKLVSSNIEEISMLKQLRLLTMKETSFNDKSHTSQESLFPALAEMIVKSFTTFVRKDGGMLYFGTIIILGPDLYTVQPEKLFRKETNKTNIKKLKLEICETPHQKSYFEEEFKYCQSNNLVLVIFAIEDNANERRSLQSCYVKLE